MIRHRSLRLAVTLTATVMTLLLASGAMFVARGADPIKIGFGMALTGGLSANGKPALLALQIWKDDVNKKGGLLGRPVELVYYDDQTNPATIPGIYTKLLEVDKVDLVISGYGTNLIAPLLPIAMERKLTLIGMFGLANNEKYQYPSYFQIQPAGPDPQTSTAIGFFELALRQNPKPQTVAIVGADAEYPQNAMVGARELIKKFGFKTVYDKNYPPSTVDYTPIVRAIQATSPDLVFIASYPVDSVGMVRAATEIGLKTQPFGGGMVGMQYASFMGQLADKLNRVVNYHLYVPSPKMKFPGIEEFLQTYQARAPQQGTDPLGFYQPPFAYAAVQVLEQAIKATGSLDDGKLADYIHKNAFDTIVGEIRFDERGEWAKPRLLMVQFQNVQGSSLDQYKQSGKQVILYPAQYRDGDVQYPFAK